MDYVKVAYFTKNNCRIIAARGEHLDFYKKAKNCVIEPDLSRVRGEPPHFWKLKGGQVIPMGTDERVARWKDICDNGVDNTIEEPSAEMGAHQGLTVSPFLKAKWYLKAHYREILIYTSLGAILGYLIH